MNTKQSKHPNKFFRKTTLLMVMAMSVLSMSFHWRTAAAVTILASHEGATNPLSEGWFSAHFEGDVLVSGASYTEVSVGPVVNDQGFNAWMVNDTTAALRFSSSEGYARSLTPMEIADAVTTGFALNVRLKVPELSDVPNGSVYVGFYTGTTEYSMAFGSESNGDPSVVLLGSSIPVFTLDGGGSGYHLYQLVFNPSSSTTDLFVDGVQRVIGYEGRTIPSQNPYIYWGSGHAFDTGEGRYNLVQLSAGSNAVVVPIPSTLILFGSGISALFGFSCNRKRLATPSVHS